MAVLGEIRHTTTDKYAKPVSFGTHRAMFLPRRGASARLLNWSVRTNPPSKVKWISDPVHVTVMDFSEPASELTFNFKVIGIYFGVKGVEASPLESRAEEVPIQYTPDVWYDLVSYLRPHAEDPDSSLAAWTFTAPISTPSTARPAVVSVAVWPYDTSAVNPPIGCISDCATRGTPIAAPGALRE